MRCITMRHRHRILCCRSCPGKIAKEIAARMMKLSLMVAFFDTADEGDRHSPIADEIAARWFDFDVQVAHCHSDTEFVFSLATDKAYFLRFSHDSEWDIQTIEAELDCVEYLARQGIRIARPVPAKSGACIERIETPLGPFHAVLYEALPGLNRNLDDLDEGDCLRWGRALGELHAASLDLEADRPSWAEQLAKIRQIIPAEEQGALSELADVEHRLDRLDSAPDEFGLVHYDFTVDNLLWQGEEIGIADLRDCAYSPFAADVALALRDLCDDRIAQIDFQDDRLQTFVAGYRAAKPLTEAALRQLPLYIRLGNLLSFARALWSLGEGPLQPEPVWTTEMRRDLVATLQKDRHDFVENPLRLFV